MVWRRDLENRKQRNGQLGIIQKREQKFKIPKLLKNGTQTNPGNLIKKITN